MPTRANAEQRAAERRVRAAVSAALAHGARVVLAVSGGRDSMVLLDAVARWRPRVVAAVASFDHGTGDAARAAVELVRSSARALGVSFVRGPAQTHGGDARSHATEAAWRASRWAFLQETADTLRAVVATAHTLDDQVETVFMRALRGAGPRGLAGMFAGGAVVRPFLSIPRDTIATYAALRALPFVHDPSNRSRRYLRNRVRLDLLPALEAVQPGFGRALLDIARRAAAWRADVERRVDAMRPRRTDTSVFVATDALTRYDERALAHLWPALAARAGIALDRRGTVRLAAFSSQQGRGRRVQLSGNHEVVRHGHAFEIRPAHQLTRADAE
jgi:tRNA(Ile)-lysidine synthase